MVNRLATRRAARCFAFDRKGHFGQCAAPRSLGTKARAFGQQNRRRGNEEDSDTTDRFCHADAQLEIILRKIAIFVAAGGAIALVGCTSTPPESSGASAPAKSGSFTLSDGTYNGIFSGGGCGKMVIGGGGASINYSFGRCGGSPSFTSPGRFDGKTIRIQQATYVLSGATANSMTGNWKLRSYSANVTFKK